MYFFQWAFLSLSLISIVGLIWIIAEIRFERERRRWKAWLAVCFLYVAFALACLWFGFAEASPFVRMAKNTEAAELFADKAKELADHLDTVLALEKKALSLPPGPEYEKTFSQLRELWEQQKRISGELKELAKKKEE